LPEVNIQSNDYVAPGTAIEVTIAEIWQALLGLEQVGIHDDFFELGGNSLMVAQILVAIKQKTTVLLPIKAIFDCPTIKSLAEFAEVLLQTKTELSPTGNQEKIIEVEL
jgi:acyl carrier protein